MAGRWWILRTLGALAGLWVLANIGAMGFWKDDKIIERNSQATGIQSYWQKINLSPRLVEDVLTEEFCPSSERAFLSCVNALDRVAAQLGYEVSFDGQLLPLKNTPFARNEKLLLEPWKRFYEESSFEIVSFPVVKIWQQLINQAEPAQRSYLIALAYNAYLSIYRDPHTYIIPAQYYRDVVSSSQTMSQSLGFVLVRSDGRYFVRKVMPFSQADKAGLIRGDRILEIDGHDLAKVSQYQLNDLMAVKRSRAVVIKVQRGSSQKLFEIMNSAQPVPNVTWHWLKTSARAKTALLTINKFSERTCELTEGVLREIKQQKVNFLLLDLRDNSGGHMAEASCVVSLFVGPGMLVYKTKYLDSSRSGDLDYTAKNQIWKGSTAVLINSGTASAAEIVAGSLRDYQRAILVGERSFGKGSFQEGELWANNKQVAIFETKGLYFLPSGEAPQLRGLKPDLQISDTAVIADREEDQYLFPLRGVELGLPEVSGKVIETKNCLKKLASKDMDAQILSAAGALECSAVATIKGDLRASQ